MAVEGRRSLESSSVQAAVGLFVAVAVFGFLWLLIALRQGPERYPLVAEFDVLGASISEATPVKLRGFPVGRVQSVEFRPTPPEGQAHFLVVLGIEAGYPVPDGAVAEIRGSGLVGESYIHLDVSGAEGGRLPAGAHLPGRSDESMKGLMAKLRDAAHKLGGAGSAIRDARLGERLGQIGGSVETLAGDLGRMSHSADSLLAASRNVVVDLEPGMARSLQNLEATMAQLAVTLGRTDTLIAATGHDVRASVHALRRLVERLEGVAGRVDTLVQRRRGQIDSTVVNVHATSAAVRALSQDPWKLLLGRGDGRVAEEMAPPAGADSSEPRR